MGKLSIWIKDLYIVLLWELFPTHQYLDEIFKRKPKLNENGNKKDISRSCTTCIREIFCRFILRLILLFFPYRLINEISSLLLSELLWDSLLRELKQDVLLKVRVLIWETDYVYIEYFHRKNSNRNRNRFYVALLKICSHYSFV